MHSVDIFGLPTGTSCGRLVAHTHAGRRGGAAVVHGTERAAEVDDSDVRLVAGGRFPRRNVVAVATPVRGGIGLGLFRSRFAAALAPRPSLKLYGRWWSKKRPTTERGRVRAEFLYSKRKRNTRLVIERVISTGRHYGDIFQQRNPPPRERPYRPFLFCFSPENLGYR